MNGSTPTDLFGTTVNPCPSWCTMPAGHGYDCGDHTEESRTHTHDFGIVPFGTGGETVVSVWALEHLGFTPEGLVMSHGAPTVYADEANGMTADQARALASKLLEAADLLDRITPGGAR